MIEQQHFCMKGCTFTEIINSSQICDEGTGIYSSQVAEEPESYFKPLMSFSVH